MTSPTTTAPADSQTSGTTAVPTSSLYADLLTEHPHLVDRVQDRDAMSDDDGPGRFVFGHTPNGEGTPLAGLAWQTNYDGGEEHGARQLIEVLTGPVGRNYRMVPGARSHLAALTDIAGAPAAACALALSTGAFTDPDPDGPIVRGRWGDPLRRYAGTRPPTYPRTWIQERDWAQGMPTLLDRETMPTLRDLARRLDIAPLPRRKADLLAAIRGSEGYRELATRPDAWPALFGSGETLILRADTGPLATIVRRLIDAADHGTLGVANASGPFATGVFFYDTRDEHPTLVAEREAAWNYHDTRMPIADRLADGLRADGYRVHFLGNPSVLNPGNRETGEPRYTEPREVFWINAYHGATPVFGYYTAEEIEHRAMVPYDPRR